MTKLSSNFNRRPHKTPPKHAGKRTSKYRSKYEAAIALANPNCLQYEVPQCKFRFEVYESPSMIPAEAVSQLGINESVSVIEKHWLGRLRTRTYTIDWLIPAEHSSTGKDIFIESKGLLSLDDVSKIKAFLFVFGDIVDYRLLFQRDNRIGGFKRTAKVSEWATQLGIPYAIGEVIPTDWFKQSK